MPIRPPLTIAAVVAVVAAIAGATPANASEQRCSDVAVTATTSHHLQMRTDLAAGAVHFRVRGAAGENLQLARPRHGSSIATLIADGDQLNATGIPTALERDFTAFGGTGVGSDLWVRLAPGTYYALDTNADTQTADEVVVLHVRGDVHRGRLPATRDSIAAVGDMDWASRPRHIAASGVLRFVNASSEWHFLELAHVKTGTTQAQLEAALKSGDESIIVGDGDMATGVISPGVVQASTYDLPKGEYALLCFWPDENGVPHALMGMARLIQLG